MSKLRKSLPDFLIIKKYRSFISLTYHLGIHLKKFIDYLSKLKPIKIFSYTSDKNNKSFFKKLDVIRLKRSWMKIIGTDNKNTFNFIHLLNPGAAYDSYYFLQLFYLNDKAV